jgi:hypothetical protein
LPLTFSLDSRQGEYFLGSGPRIFRLGAQKGFRTQI